MPNAYDPQRTSVPLEPPKRRAGFLPLLLGLLTILVIVAIILLLGSCGSSSGGDTVASTPPATAAAPLAPSSVPSLTAGSDLVLGGAAQRISVHAGDPAIGVHVKVLSVVKSGFFVGTNRSDRQYVEFGAVVGKDESAQPLPKVGDVVGLKGQVRPLPQNPGRTLHLDSADATLVSERGAYVNATTVTPGG